MLVPKWGPHSRREKGLRLASSHLRSLMTIPWSQRRSPEAAKALFSFIFWASQKMNP